MVTVEERVVAPLAAYGATPAANTPIPRKLPDPEALLPTRSPVYRCWTTDIIKQSIVTLGLVVAMATSLSNRIELLREGCLSLGAGVGWLRWVSDEIILQVHVDIVTTFYSILLAIKDGWLRVACISILSMLCTYNRAII